MHFLQKSLAILALGKLINGHYVTRGVQIGIDLVTGEVPARQNILDLSKNQYQWALYIQALTEMQQMDPSDITSYFQIAGIHGLPFSSWDGIEGSPSVNTTGYCTHGDILFPTWHRPYMALFEQVISEHAQSIAKKYTGANQEAFSIAAEKLRIPFWDWASNSDIPGVVSSSTVSILTPSGVQDVPNPLASYTFPEGNKFPPDVGFGGLSDFPTTVRGSDANDYLKRSQGEFYELFTKLTTYPPFATYNAVGPPSFESIHGDIHVEVCSYSPVCQMAVPAYAGFDPIFWLHHAQVDRVFALWQAIYPDEYIPSVFDETMGMSDTGTFTDINGSPVSSKTGLTPFSISEDGTKWNSDDARFLNPFGYTYPEINYWNRTTKEQQTNVLAAFNALYSPKPTSTTSAKLIKRAGSTNTWAVRAEFEKSAGDDDIIVFTFLGDSPADSSTWPLAQNLVGTLHPFIWMGPNSKTFTAHREFTLDKPLTTAGITARDPKSLIPYLKKNLTWKVRKMDGTIVDPETVPGLKVSVFEQAVTTAPNHKSFPKYGAKTPHPEATKGKTGGVAA